MSQLRTTSNGGPPHQGVGFDAPVEQGGTTVLLAGSSRTHTATRAPRDRAHGRRFDARMSGDRALGAFVLRDGTLHWRPAVDVTRIVTTAEVVVGAVLVARHLTARPSGAKALVTMGPGGWVSMKGGAMSVRPAKRAWIPRRSPAPPAIRTRRPWWARLLSAQALNALLG